MLHIKDTARNPAAVQTRDARNDIFEHAHIVAPLEERNEVRPNRAELVLAVKHSILRLPRRKPLADDVLVRHIDTHALGKDTTHVKEIALDLK